MVQERKGSHRHKVLDDQEVRVARVVGLGTVVEAFSFLMRS